MGKHPRVFLILILLIIPTALAVLFILKQEPITSGSLPVKAADPNTYIIFLSGLETFCDGTPYNQMGFHYFRRQLAHAGMSYKDKRFLQYSYKGGNVINGSWNPNPYNHEDTGQPIEFSVLRLKEMIEEFSLHHPQARFVLIGHSLGGRIAFDYVAKYHLKRPEPVKGVITLNSPLTGSPYTLINIMEHLRPCWGWIAVRQLAAEYQLRNELNLLNNKKEAAHKMTEKGIGLATFATVQDVIVIPDTAYLKDKKGNPLGGGEIITVNILSSNLHELVGHRQILYEPRVADYIIQFITTP